MLYSLERIGGGGVEFTKEVERLLMNEEEPVQELWRRVVHQFELDGPEHAEGYLRGQRKQYEVRIRRLLQEYENA